MEIGTEPVFKLPPEDVLPFDIQRCLLCQLSEGDKLVKNSSQIANILDKFKLHEHHETGQYSKKKQTFLCYKKRLFKPKLTSYQTL